MVVYRRRNCRGAAAPRPPDHAARSGFHTDRGRQRDLEEGPAPGSSRRTTLPSRTRPPGRSRRVGPGRGACYPRRRHRPPDRPSGLRLPLSRLCGGRGSTAGHGRPPAVRRRPDPGRPGRLAYLRFRNGQAHSKRRYQSRHSGNNRPRPDRRPLDFQRHRGSCRRPNAPPPRRSHDPGPGTPGRLSRDARVSAPGETHRRSVLRRAHRPDGARLVRHEIPASTPWLHFLDHAYRAGIDDPHYEAGLGRYWQAGLDRLRGKPPDIA